jgi:hypothetical protein
VQLHWGGGTPTFMTPEEIRALGAATREQFPFASGMEASVEIDPRRVTLEHLRALRDAGFNRASIGVQDFDPKVQVAVHRFQPYAQTKLVINQLRELGFQSINLDLIYGSGKLGRRVAPDLYVTGGVRRVALDYDITLGDLPNFSRKPGVWDPIVGIGWHRVRPKIEWHAAFDGGGFGVGADVDLGASLSVDWKPIPHFGLTAGYNILYLKVTDLVASRDLTMKLTAHGPTVGFGLYF